MEHIVTGKGFIESLSNDIPVYCSKTFTKDDLDKFIERLSNTPIENNGYYSHVDKPTYPGVDMTHFEVIFSEDWIDDKGRLLDTNGMDTGISIKTNILARIKAYIKSIKLYGR